MAKKLNVADARAVDLLLDRTSIQSSSGFTPATDAAETDRVNSASNLFKLLAQMPEDEVPADLLAKTLKRISAATQSAQPTDEARPTLPTNRPGPLA